MGAAKVDQTTCTCDTHVLYVGTSSIEVSGQLLMIFTKFTTISQCVQAKRIETSYLIYVNVDGLAESMVKSGLVRCAVSGVCPVLVRMDSVSINILERVAVCMPNKLKEYF